MTQSLSLLQARFFRYYLCLLLHNRVDLLRRSTRAIGPAIRITPRLVVRPRYTDREI